MAARKQKKFRATFRVNALISVEVPANTLDEALGRANQMVGQAALFEVGDDADSVDDWTTALVGVDDAAKLDIYE